MHRAQGKVASAMPRSGRARKQKKEAPEGASRVLRG